MTVTGLAAGETVQSVTVGLDGYTFYDGGTVDFAGTAEPVFSAADVNAAVRVLPGVSASGDPAGYMVGIVPLDLGGRSARMDVTVITRQEIYGEFRGYGARGGHALHREDGCGFAPERGGDLY